MARPPHRIELFVAAFLVASAAVSAFAQAPAPVPAPAASPAAPTPPGARLVSSIRNKLSAGDLRSAESLAEVWRETQGDEGSYLLALSWLARGGVLLGDFDRAGHYAAETRTRCDARMARGVRPDADDSLEIALGAAIEVEAQVREKTKGKADPLRFPEPEQAPRVYVVGVPHRRSPNSAPRGPAIEFQCLAASSGPVPSLGLRSLYLPRPSLVAHPCLRSRCAMRRTLRVATVA